MAAEATKVNSSTASAQDRANYMEVAFTTNRELGEVILLLEHRKSGFANGAETQFIDANIDTVRSQRLTVSADLNAFLGDSLAIAPPSDADVEAVKDLVHRIDTMTAQSTEASAMMKAATELLTIWRKTR
jgi:hypothetical protein